MDKRVLRVESTGEEITAPKIFIACGSAPALARTTFGSRSWAKLDHTGARPAAPPIDGLESTPYITYVEALRMTKVLSEPYVDQG